VVSALAPVAFRLFCSGNGESRAGIAAGKRVLWCRQKSYL